MKAAERIAQMEAENASLRAALAAAQQQVAHLTARLRDLEQRLAKDSHNSSKPPPAPMAPSLAGCSRPPKDRRKTYWMPCCTRPSRCWRLSKTQRCPLRR